MSSDTENKISKIDLTSQIDFTKGFSSFHIRWPVNNASLSKQHRSSYFDTPIKRGNGTPVFSWIVGISKRDDGSVWFGLYPGNLPFSLGIIYRLALCDGNKDPFFVTASTFQVFDNNDGPLGFGAIYSSEKVASFVGDDLVLHCWIEIPTDIERQVTRRDYAKLSTGKISTISSFHAKGGNNLLADVSQLINGVLNEDLKDFTSDVTLAIVRKSEKGEIQILRRFFCHRAILAARSPVFKTMFSNNQWKESTDKDRSVDIDDVSASTMEYVLRYIYTGYIVSNPNGNTSPSLKCDEYLAIVHAAEKYFLHDLKDFCVVHLICYASSDKERLDQFLVADRYRVPQLKAVCLASLASIPDGIDEEIPPDLFMELYKATAKKSTGIKELTVNGNE